jgi:uncharacterized protein (TIGR02300 family)
VAKTEWGQKRVCASCGTRYYDMKKNPAVCPSCGTAFDPEAALRTRRGRSAPKVIEPAPLPEVIEEIPVVEGEEAEDAVIEDAEELGGEEVEEVVEAEEGG